MANKVPTEILIKILNNLQSSSKSTRDLYSSLLVNRIWCKVTIPILWELPFGQNCSTKTDTDYKKLNKKALCIRTYISYQDNNNSKDVDKEFVTTVSRILFHEICKLIINRCTFLDYFKLATVPLHSPFYYFNYKDLICSILELPGAPKVFKKLESFTSKIRSDDNLIGSLYESLTLICDNILNMNLYFKSIPQDQLIKLISVQKRLENLSINGDYRLLTNSLFFEAIISKKETLKNLRLKKLNFSYFREKLSLNGQFILLQKLYIKNCYELQESDCLILASSFTQLSSFYYFHPRGYSSYPREFIIEILKTANTNLRNIFLD
ncbi:4626_t:CDS:2, partial [Diversispora eburnea]